MTPIPLHQGEVMASVKCPECGERVKLRDDTMKLRCRECGAKFRAPDEDDEDELEEEDERPRKQRKAPAKKSSGVKIAAIAVGGVLTLALVVLGIILLVRDKGGSTAPSDPSKVTVENFQRVKPGMDLAEVESILGGGKSSSENDMRDAFRKGLGEIEAAWETGFARFGEGSEWRRWDGKNLRVWVAFGKTKEGQRAAFSTALEQNGSAYKRHEGFLTWAGPLGHDLDELNETRKKEDAVRKDAKWVRGGQAPTLVAGEWRNESGDGLIFATDGKLTEDNPVSQTMNRDRQPTYRVLDDKKLTITHPPPPAPPPPPGFPPSPFKFEAVTRTYEYFVNNEELALIEVTPHAHHAGIVLRTFYRMPPKLGGAADQKLIAPLVADLKGNDKTKRQLAFYKLKRYGRGAASALPALTELLRSADDTIVNQAADTIGNMREAGAPAVPELAAQLRDPNSKRNYAIVHALGRIGPAAKPALPALQELVAKSTDWHLKNEAQSVIRGLGGKSP